MDWLLRRNFWMVKLLGALVVSVFLANTTTTIIGLWLFGSARGADTIEAAPLDEDEDELDDADDEATLATSAAPRRDPQRIGEQILGRNLFCPECRPLDSAPVLEGDAEAVGSGFEGAPRSALPLELSATMEAEDPSLSLATIRNAQAGYAGLFSVGDALGEGVQLVAIAAGRVDILNAGRAEYIPLGPAPPAAPMSRTAKPATAEPTTAKPTAGIPGADDAIKCDGGGCQVERGFVESLIAKPQLLVGQGSARPAKTPGGDAGFRLAGVKKGSLPDLLGLKSGDIITEVGGQPLTYDSLMALYPKLRNAKHIEVTLDRRGERLSKALEIVS